VSSNVNIPGVGDKTFYGLDLVPETNIDHTIAVLAGGTLNAVGDSLTLPIELTIGNCSTKQARMYTMLRGSRAPSPELWGYSAPR
jgi:hypothetical protein